MGVVYVGGGLSLMGKGFLGPGLIGLLILVDMLVSGRIRRLHRVGLASGVVIFGLIMGAFETPSAANERSTRALLARSSPPI